MTDKLRAALREAVADGPRSEVTGRDLLQRGRRKARLRRISSTAGGLALAAAVGVPLVPHLLEGPDDGGSGGPPVATPPDRTTKTPDRTATTGNDRGCGPATGLANWAVRVDMRDDTHRIAVLVSPDGERWSTCDQAYDTKGGEWSWSRSRVETDPGYRWLRIDFWDDDCATGSDDRMCMWGAAGQIPVEVARMTFESADGRTSDANISDGFFAWQSEVDRIQVFNHPLWATLYDASGDQIARVDVNDNPLHWPLG